MGRSEAEVERLVNENQKLVQLVVTRYLKKYFVGTMDREDLVSWGLIGLVQAARFWDPERGASFSTLAYKAIERMIIRGVRREWKPDLAAATVSLDEFMAGDETAGTTERFVERMAAEQNVEGELLNGATRAAVRAAVAELAPAAGGSLNSTTANRPTRRCKKPASPATRPPKIATLSSPATHLDRRRIEMAATTQEVLTHHQRSFGDIAGTMAGYTDESRLFTPEGLLRGAEAIRAFFVRFFAEFAKPGMSRERLWQEVDGDTAYVVWRAETADNRYELGTDTFLVRDGKIVTQTFAAKISPKR